MQGWGVALGAESDPWWAASKELSSATHLDEFGSKFFLRAPDEGSARLTS